MAEYIEHESQLRKDCPMRHENGNCLPCGGFCTAVNAPICAAMHNAYYMGKTSAADVVEVVHGEWIFNRGQAYGEPLYFCSVCTDGGSEWGKDKYCPNCGAKMSRNNV